MHNSVNGAYTCRRRRLLDVEERRHVLPLGQAVLELQHLVLNDTDVLRDLDELCIAAQVNDRMQHAPTETLTSGRRPVVGPCERHPAVFAVMIVESSARPPLSSPSLS